MKITPIHEKLWGALNIVTNHMDMAIATTRCRDTRLVEANELLKEFSACHGSDGRVSQRGEVPNCWNPETIFTPLRELKPNEILLEQPPFPFGDNESLPTK